MDRDDLNQEISTLSAEQRALFELLMRQESGAANAASVGAPKASNVPDIPTDTGEVRYPMSFAQRQLWFLDQLRPGSAAYNVACGLRFTGSLDLAALEASIDQLVARHGALRTTFAVLDDEPMQIVRAHQRTCLPIVDLVGLEPTARKALCARVQHDEATRPFDLVNGPLFRATLIELSRGEYILILCVHHIVFDAWSMGVLLQELSALYAARATGKPNPLPPVTRQLADFALWQRERITGEHLARLRSYWKKRLEGAPPLLQLPTDHTRPPEQGFRGALHAFELPPALVKGVQSLGTTHGTSIFMTMLAAFQILLHRYTGQEDILVGSPMANRNRAGLDSVIGFLVNPVVFRTDLSGDPTAAEVLRRVRSVSLGVYDHNDMPFELLVEELRPERDLSHNPVFQVSCALVSVPRIELPLTSLNVEVFNIHTGTSKFDLTFDVWESASGLRCTFEYNTDLFSPGTMARMSEHFLTLLAAMVEAPERPVSVLPLLTGAERQRMLQEWNATAADYPRTQGVHEAIADQAARRPEALALSFQAHSLSYEQFHAAATRVARELRERGMSPGDRVGLCVERSLEMVVGMVGILAAGGAYVPLDPSYPEERLAYVLGDCGARLVVASKHLEPLVSRLGQASAKAPEVLLVNVASGSGSAGNDRSTWAPTRAEQLAYVMYTSGSTGKPKGVMVSHRNVMNFFAGMDRVLDHQEPGVWLAVTSFAFDISVLELLWTLSRGFHVIIQPEQHLVASGKPRPAVPARDMAFSLLYFSSTDRAGAQNKYRLLMEGARFADENGFDAVWTPERHFHAFGGLYPDPAITGAMVAAITRRVHIRAGSVVLPLHDPIRVAEAWSVIDNVSGGRVGIGFASGWHADDFVFAPDLYQNRKQVLRERIDTVRRLWRGETLVARGGTGKPVNVKVYPTPVQPELPVWVTAAGSPDTFELAGELGAGVLTHLLGQTPQELREKIAIYRKAWKAHGHPGEGRVTLMLHTFVDENLESLREKVRKPFCDYLRTSVGLMRNLARSVDVGFDVDQVSDADMNALIEHAFDRYTGRWGLFGTVETCLEKLNELSQLGVNEVACLVDFGMADETVLTGLQRLAAVQRAYRGNATASAGEPAEEAADFSVAAQLQRHRVTHLQCTPSLARLLLEDPDTAAALRGLDRLLVGGEALPMALAQDLRQKVKGEVINMYGPTETTIWSTSHRLRDTAEVLIGRPMANTQVYVVDRHRNLVPPGVPGELLLGGDGVAAGYLGRPELTQERFIPDGFGHGERLYRTGDLVRSRPDGALEFLGRIDHQVKIRGHRIELGELESVLAGHQAVKEAVVVAQTREPGDTRLIACIVAEEGYRSGGVGKALEGAEEQRVEQWERIWDDTYQKRDDTSDPTFEITGWRSSYTGEPIAAHEMREWVDGTVARLRALRPRRVLEIGCGTGLLLFRLAPQCEQYVGVDVSADALAHIRAHLSGELANRVTLYQREADALTELARELGQGFDVVIINSVAQYFPSADYLMRVLGQCLELVAPGGAVFLGDIRNHALLEAMHTSIELHQAASELPLDSLARRITERTSREEELVLDPAFFTALPAALPRVSHVGVQIKRGAAINEMTAFRYDVTLFVEHPVRDTTPIEWIHWDTVDGGLPALRRRLTDQRPPRLGVRRVPSERLAHTLRAMELLAQRDRRTVGELRTRLTEAGRAQGVATEDWWHLPGELPYAVDVTWSENGSDGCHDVVLTHTDCGMDLAGRALAPPMARPGTSTHNQPLVQVMGRLLGAELRTYLQQRVPEFMVPNTFVVLEHLPLTPNGKVDRKQLVAMHEDRGQGSGAYVAPRTELEQRLAATWRDVLGVARVGLADNFFDLGGNSLAATQLVFRLRREFSPELPLNLLFDAPTVQTLARALEARTAAGRASGAGAQSAKH